MTIELGHYSFNTLIYSEVIKEGTWVPLKTTQDAASPEKELHLIVVSPDVVEFWVSSRNRSDRRTHTFARNRINNQNFEVKNSSLARLLGFKEKIIWISD